MSVIGSGSIVELAGGTGQCRRTTPPAWAVLSAWPSTPTASDATGLVASRWSCTPRASPAASSGLAKLLKFQGLRAIQPKSFVPRTTDSRHGLGYSPNLLAAAPPPARVNQTWVADITYVPLRGGAFAYLALMMDLFSRRVVGWDLADSHDRAARPGSAASSDPQPATASRFDPSQRSRRTIRRPLLPRRAAPPHSSRA